MCARKGAFRSCAHARIEKLGGAWGRGSSTCKCPWPARHGTLENHPARAVKFFLLGRESLHNDTASFDTSTFLVNLHTSKLRR